MISFQEFLNEDNSNNLNKLNNLKNDKISYQDYLDNVIDSCQKDLGMTKSQAIEFTLLYRELLRDAWVKRYTTKEAIASTKRPGVIIKDGDVKESLIFDIDVLYEDYIDKINYEKKPDNIKAYVNNYYSKFNESYSDKRIFERVKNNYTNLKKLANKRIFEMQYTTDVGTLEVDVIERNDILIDEIINGFSFAYKKKKDRYIRPIKITGKTLYKNIELEVFLSNKDVVKITYDDTEGIVEEFKVHINNKLIFHLDYFDMLDIVSKTVYLYKKHLSRQNFKIVTKTNPFD